MLGGLNSFFIIASACLVGKQCNFFFARHSTQNSDVRHRAKFTEKLVTICAFYSRYMQINGNYSFNYK